MLLEHTQYLCFTGSRKGEIFVNLPGKPITTCGSNNSPCLNNFDSYANAVLQIGVSGNESRVISGGLTGLTDMSNYPTAKSLADGSWLLFTIGDPQYNKPSQLLMAKLPPFTAQDNVDRSTFIRTPISITPPAGQGIASVAVEFGYLEQGLTSQYYCTSRREFCIATQTSVTDSNPFSYEQTENFTPLPCTNNCTITLPVLPMHVAYYKVKYYDVNGVFLANGDQGVAVESSVGNINNLSPVNITSTISAVPTVPTTSLSPIRESSTPVIPIQTKIIGNENSNLSISVSPLVISTTTTTSLPPKNNIRIITHSLHKSLRDSDVSILQSFLIDKGYLALGNITGYYGVLTQEAVKKFQLKSGIISSPSSQSKEYGMVGEITLSTINFSLSPAITSFSQVPLSIQKFQTFTQDLFLGMKNDDVRKLQIFLNNNGFIISTNGVGSLNNEGTFFGPQTKQALIKYQISQHIVPADGFFGPLTRDTMNK